MTTSLHTRIEQRIARGLSDEVIAKAESVPAAAVASVRRYLDAINEAPEGSEVARRALRREINKAMAMATSDA